MQVGVQFIYEHNPLLFERFGGVRIGHHQPTSQINRQGQHTAITIAQVLERNRSLIIDLQQGSACIDVQQRWLG